ncbi:peptidyl-tRNA hydrolase [Phlebopus sp. FC_14]|nr:peptidyl-tRNA hydrolase [Phlebopus sp. FC_14]
MTFAVKLPQLLVVGLGNLPYPKTRHSVGHLIVDALAGRYGIRMANDRTLGGIAGRSIVLIDEQYVDLTLFKPKPLMNITGPAVACALRHTAKAPSAMIVIHDSLGHKPRILSVKFGGSANGHNGVRSVISALGGNLDFHRFRIGIGRDGDAAEYVLSKMPADEILYWDVGPGLDSVCSELRKIALKSS